MEDSKEKWERIRKKIQEMDGDFKAKMLKEKMETARLTEEEYFEKYVKNTVLYHRAKKLQSFREWCVYMLNIPVLILIGVLEKGPLFYTLLAGGLIYIAVWFYKNPLFMSYGQAEKSLGDSENERRI